MISLNPPYQVIDGYTVLSDHADPQQFYVLPPAPSLRMNDDGVPSFSLIQYLGGGIGDKKIEGGLLTLTTELRVPDGMLSSLAERLAQRTGTTASSLCMMPVMFDSGTVEIIALGSTSVPGDTTTVPGPFSVRFLGSGKPSLGGTNLATFQILLDAAASELIEQAIETPDLPIIVIYCMAFAGLRPSFRLDVRADWRKLYKSLQNKVGANAYIIAANAESMVSESLEENGIKVSETVFGTSEQDRADAEKARKQLVDWALQYFFTPVADPKGAMASSIGQVVEDSVWSLARTVLPGVSYKLRYVSDEQMKSLSVRMDESVAESREVVPQGTIGGLLYGLRVDQDGGQREGWAALRARLISKINMDGFRRLEVRTSVENRFESDGLSEVRVEFARRMPDGALADRQAFAFRDATEYKTYIVNLLGKADFGSPYVYRLEILFNPSGPFGPHEPVSTDWIEGRTGDMVVEPRIAYTVRKVKAIVSPTFSFKEFPAIGVELRYVEDKCGPQAGALDLGQARPEGAWSFRSITERLPPYEYRMIYRKAAGAGGDILTPWRTGVDELLSVSDPIPVKRPLNLFFSMPWDEISVGFIQIRYRDDKNGISYDEQIDLDPSVRYVRRDYPIDKSGPRTIAYRLTVLFKKGLLLDGQWRETDEDRLAIDSRLVENRMVRYQTIGGGLDENRLSKVSLRLQARDPGNSGVRAEKEFVLSPGNEPKTMAWEYLSGDPPAAVYFEGLFVDKDGFVSSQSWKEMRSEMLVINLRAKTMDA